MTKHEAAQLLQVSARAINRYVSSGKLSVTYSKNSQGSMVGVYNEDEVLTLKENQARYLQPKEKAKPARKNEHPKAGVTALTRRESDKGVMALLVRLAEATEAQVKSRPLVPVEAQLTLTLSDASHLSKLSKDYLLAAVRTGKLKAAKRGRGWNIKRSDLDDWVKKLP